MDNCSDYNDLVITGFPLPKSFFPIGTTSVAWTATDDDGNSSNCAMDITIEMPGSPTPSGWTSSPVGTTTNCGTNYDGASGTLLISTTGGTVGSTFRQFLWDQFP